MFRRCVFETLLCGLLMYREVSELCLFATRLFYLLNTLTGAGETRRFNYRGNVTSGSLRFLSVPYFRFRVVAPAAEQQILPEFLRRIPQQL